MGLFEREYRGTPTVDGGQQFDVEMPLSAQIIEPFRFALPGLEQLCVGQTVTLKASLLSGRRYGDVIEVWDAQVRERLGQLTEYYTRPPCKPLFCLNYERSAQIVAIEGASGEAFWATIKIRVRTRKRMLRARGT